MPMDSAASLLPSALQSNVEFVAQYGRTLVQHTAGATHSPQSFPQRSRAHSGAWRVPPHDHVAPKPFIWTKSGQDILTKEHRARIILDKTRTP